MRKYVLLFVLIAFIVPLSAQNYKFQALYIYNIAQRIEWPAFKNGFTVGVFNCDAMVDELRPIAHSRKLNGHPIKVKQLRSLQDDLTSCDLLYIGRTASSKLPEIKQYIGDLPVLLVSDKSGLTGAGINFIDNSSKIVFEVYPEEIKSHNLNVSGSLLNLGIVKE